MCACGVYLCVCVGTCRCMGILALVPSTMCCCRSMVNFYDGRKEMPQKVEVAVRLREPLSGADVEEKQIKW